VIAKDQHGLQPSAGSPRRGARARVILLATWICDARVVVGRGCFCFRHVIRQQKKEMRLAQQPSLGPAFGALQVGECVPQLTPEFVEVPHGPDIQVSRFCRRSLDA